MTKSKNASKGSKNNATKTSKVKLANASKIKPEDTSKVASKTGLSLGYVSNVKAGRRYNVAVINSFNGLTARRK
jgi:hypothetical protein